MAESTKTTAGHALLQATRNGTRDSIGELAVTNSTLLAMATKLVPSENPSARDRNGNNTVTTPRLDNLMSISQSISRKKKDAQAIQELFPDVRLAMEIFIVSVISPNDMFTEEIGFSVSNKLYCQPIIDGLISLTREYFERDYLLMDKIYLILKESCYGGGSYPILVLPESSLDELIHGGPAVVKKLSNATERERLLGNVVNPQGRIQTLGYLGPAGTHTQSSGRISSALENMLQVATESQINIDSTIRVPNSGVNLYAGIHDNPEVIRYSRLCEVVRNAKERDIQRRLYPKATAAVEHEVLNDQKLASLLYASPRANAEPMVRIRTLSQTARETLGEALQLDLPPESVYPIIAPGEPTKKVAYIVLLDQTGYPVRDEVGADMFDSMRMSKYSSNQDLNSFILQKAQSQFGAGCVDPTLAQGAQIYGEIIDADVMARFRNGVLGSEVVISNAENVYRVMFARALRQRYTQMLYVPEEMLTYFAIDVNADGTGKSMLEGVRTTAAMRAALLIARSQGAMNAAVGRTEAKVTVDEEDTDRLATIEAIRAEILSARSGGNLTNSLNPTDIITQMGMAGIQINVEGNTRVPGTKVEYNDVPTTYNRPDQELDDYFTEAVITAVGPPPELVKAAQNLDFATIAANNNLLFAKRVRNIQKRLEPLLTHHARARLRSDGNLMTSYTEYVTEHLDSIINDKNAPPELKTVENKELLVKLLISEFISNLSVDMNQPNVKSRASQLEAMNQFTESVDKSLNDLLGDEQLDPSLVGQEAVDKLKAYRATIRGVLIRREMQKSGFMPEILDFFTKSEDGETMISDLSEEASKFFANTSIGIRELFKRLAPVIKGAEVDIGGIDVPDGSDSTGTLNPSDSSMPDTGGDSGGLGDDLDTSTNDPGTSKDDSNPGDPGSNPDDGGMEFPLT